MLKRDPDGQDMVAACAALRAAGMSATVPRLATWIVVKHATAPLLVTDIARGLARQGARVPLSSVYAALKRLNGAGLLTSHVFDDGKTRFALANRAMCHRVICTETGAEHWFDDSGFTQQVAALCRLHGFELQDYTLSIQARQVTDAPARLGAAKRIPRRAQGKGDAPLRQGDATHEDKVPTVLSYTG